MNGDIPTIIPYTKVMKSPILLHMFPIIVGKSGALSTKTDTLDFDITLYGAVLIPLTFNNCSGGKVEFADTDRIEGPIGALSLACSVKRVMPIPSEGTVKLEILSVLVDSKVGFRLSSIVFAFKFTTGSYPSVEFSFKIIFLVSP